MPNEVHAVILRNDGTAEIRHVTPDLHTLQEIVGGWIETFGPRDDSYGVWHGYCDEEGKLKGVPFNLPATALVTKLGWVGAGSDILCGTVILLGDGGEGEEGDVPDQVVKEVAAFYHDEE